MHGSRMKRRLVAVSGIVVIVLAAVLAIIGGQTAAKAVTVAQAADPALHGQKVQVTGNVVADSFSTDASGLTFRIYDPENEGVEPLTVFYDGAASSTFGNDVTAICTGMLGDDGVLQCAELVTKCPSKYESAEAALSGEQIAGYGDAMEE